MSSAQAAEHDLLATLHGEIAATHARIAADMKAKTRPVNALPQGRLMTAKRAAVELNVSITTFGNLVAAGHISRVHFDGYINAKYDRLEIDAYIEASKTKKGVVDPVTAAPFCHPGSLTDSPGAFIPPVGVPIREPVHA